MKRFKHKCAACGRISQKMSKEHFWPKWLIKRTGTNKTKVRWGDNKINPMSATIPLCQECNKDLGDGLEAPIAIVFQDLEQGNGINDREAELLIRWLWKQAGLGWIIENPQGIYTANHTLKDRVLRPIDNIRGALALAIGRIEEIDPYYGDAPMGLDSDTNYDAIFVAGVFSKLALMVVLSPFMAMIPGNFSQYSLASKPDELSGAKLFYPKVGFQTCTEAVGITKRIAITLSKRHDAIALQAIAHEQAKKAIL